MLVIMFDSVQKEDLFQNSMCTFSKVGARLEIIKGENKYCY